MLDWSLRNRGTVVWASVILFAVSAALTLSVRREFMPKLDEAHCGCARRCPTRFRSKNRRDRAAGARDLKSFPEVTDVASEHGRDDAGTDPRVSSNASSRGLKPYKTWTDRTVRSGVHC